jgi:hypothetical protein
MIDDLDYVGLGTMPWLFAPHWHVIIYRNGLAQCRLNLYM